jgi:hypothetical protein
MGWRCALNLGICAMYLTSDADADADADGGAPRLRGRSGRGFVAMGFASIFDAALTVRRRQQTVPTLVAEQ